MNLLLHRSVTLLLVIGVVWLAGVPLALRMIPLVFVALVGADVLVVDVDHRLHARRQRRLVAWAMDRLPRGGDTMDIDGLDDDEVQALAMAQAIRTGRTQYVLVNRTRGTLHWHDAGPGITIDDVPLGGNDE